MQFRRAELTVREPEFDKSCMIIIDTRDERLNRLYVNAVIDVMKLANMSPFHQIGSDDMKGLQGVEALFRKDVTTDQLKALFKDVHGLAESFYNDLTEHIWHWDEGCTDEGSFRLCEASASDLKVMKGNLPELSDKAIYCDDCERIHDELSK